MPEATLWGGMLVLVAAMMTCALLGVIIERLAYRPLRGGPTLNVLITAIGVSLLLEYSGQIVFGATPRTFPQIFPERHFELGQLSITSNQLVVITVALLLIAGLQVIVFKTRMGMAMRAVSLNPGPPSSSA